ncbi:MAG: tetratricopeptide repeat protein [Salibacteraceae bacterium]
MNASIPPERLPLHRFTRVLLAMILATLCGLSSLGQTTIDSLERAYQASDIASEQAALLNELAWLYRKSNPEKGISCARKALKIARENQFDAAHGDSYARLGLLYRKAGNYFRSLDALDSALVIRNELQDAPGVAGIYNLMGLTYSYMGKYENSVSAFLKSLRQRETLGDTVGMIKCYRNLGALFDRMEKYPESIEQYLLALQLLEQVSNPQHLASMHYALAISHYRLGDAEASRKALRQSLIYWQTQNDSASIAQAWHQLGLIWEQEGQLDSAIYYLESSRKAEHDRGNRLGAAQSLVNLGRIYRKKQNFTRAKAALTTGMEVATTAENTELQHDFAVELYALFKAQKKWDEALSYLELERQLQDSLLTESSLESVQKELAGDAERELLKARQKEAEAQAQEAAYREQALSTLSQRTNFLLLALMTGLILAVSLYLNRISSRSKALKLQQTISALEVRSINALMEGQEQERERVARELHDNVGTILSTVKLNFEQFNTLQQDLAGAEQKQEQHYQRTLELLDTAVREIRQISHNMVSGVLKQFGLVAATRDLVSAIETSGQLSINVLSINMEKRVGGQAEETAFRIVQELLTNVLKHAKAAKVTVKIEREDDLLKL